MSQQLSAHVLENFTRPCCAMFGEPPTEDTQTFFQELDRMLRGFSAEALQAGKNNVLRTHKGFSRWPKPAACVDACAEAEEAISHRTSAKASQGKPNFGRQLDMAEKHIIGTALAQRAASENWVLGLKEFVAAKSRMPNEYEIRGIIETSRFIDRCAAGAEHMGIKNAELGQLARSMLSRRETLARKVLGENHENE